MVDFVDLKSIMASADVHCTFQFLDSSFTICTNQLESLVYFRKMYADFSSRTDLVHDGRGAYYVINEPALLAKPFIYADERIYSCPAMDMLPVYAYSVITNSIITRIQSHLIFHAAAVSWQDQGIVILGDSCQGKSTLTLELIRRGFAFLTDDMTCLCRKDGRIYPFSKALGLRQSAVGLFKGFSESTFDPSCAIPGKGKLFMHLTDIPEAKVSSPCLPRFLICLSPWRGEESGYESSYAPPYEAQGKWRKDRGSLQEDKKILYLGVDRCEDGLIEGLGALPGVEKCEVRKGSLFPVIELCCRRGTFLLPEIENLCSRYKVALIHIAKNDRGSIDYLCDPHLERIPKPLALRRLLGGFRGGWTASVLKETDRGIAPLVFELGKILQGMECYRMVPGELGKMADLLCDLAAGKSGRA
ncbi:MAG: hypothetical protein AB1847_18920 [bacterium]